jgi:hypothetical protein
MEFTPTLLPLFGEGKKTNQKIIKLKRGGEERITKNREMR